MYYILVAKRLSAEADHELAAVVEGINTGLWWRSGKLNWVSDERCYIAGCVNISY
jgi:hypothetical protein